ncbi:hypothetical protein BDR04DRAFT_1108100 [Suillus decipiens]|nr:hypothetical protein BDR04DRAFT_1108100 [Suillus decipiens]
MTVGVTNHQRTGFEMTAYFASGGFLTINRIASHDLYPLHVIILIETLLVVKERRSV